VCTKINIDCSGGRGGEERRGEEKKREERNKKSNTTELKCQGLTIRCPPNKKIENIIFSLKK